jgi:hypothetical protein
LTNGSTASLDKIELIKLIEPISVYNFSVAANNNYYVSDIGILVHNAKKYNGGGKGNKNKQYDDGSDDVRIYDDRYNDNDVNPKRGEGEELFEGIPSVPEGAVYMGEGGEGKERVTGKDFISFLRRIGENPDEWFKCMYHYELKDGLIFAQHYWIKNDETMAFFHKGKSSGWFVFK